MVVFLPTLMEGAGGVLQTRIGGVPLVAVVGVAAGLVALWLAVRSRSGAPSGPGGTAIDPLAPSAAEAFGALQQQQSDLGNALSALGMGQSDILSGQTALGQQITGADRATIGAMLAGIAAQTLGPNDPRVIAWEQWAAGGVPYEASANLGSINVPAGAAA